MPMTHFSLTAIALLLAAIVATAAAVSTEPDHMPVVLLFGDSLTAGSGVAPDEAFPARIQARLNAGGRRVRIVNAGLAGETSAAGVRRIAWVLRAPVEASVLELGGNDGLRGLPLDQTESNLQAILDTVKAKSPDAALVVAGVRLPPNLGPHYTDAFESMFPRLAKANDAALIPRLLAGVGGDRELMSGDGIHPNAAGHQRVAETLWQTLEPLLSRLDASAGAAQDLEGGRVADPPAAGDADGDGQ